MSHWQSFPKNFQITPSEVKEITFSIAFSKLSTFLFLRPGRSSYKISPVYLFTTFLRTDWSFFTNLIINGDLLRPKIQARQSQIFPKKFWLDQFRGKKWKWFKNGVFTFFFKKKEILDFSWSNIDWWIIAMVIYISRNPISRISRIR